MPVCSLRALSFLALSATLAAQSTSPAPSSSPSIVGAWVLNPTLTERPQEIGFSRDWARPGAEQGGRRGGAGGGRGRRGGSDGGGAAPPPISHESPDDATRIEQLTDEARTPASRVTIVQNADSVSLADNRGLARTFHPNGRVEELTIGTVPLPTVSRWDAGSLIVTYDVESGRQLRYTFTPAGNPARLLVNIRFLERGREGDEVRLTYEPLDAHDRTVVAGAAPVPATPTASAPVPPGTSSGTPAARPKVLPPGSELRGLRTIGTVVEEIGAQGVACGLDRTRIETSIAKILADAGFKTERFGNEETYVLLSTVTSRLSDGMCVSRYDASLVTQADATLSYSDGLVAVPVQLLHEGGLAGGSPAAHTKSVTDALAASVTHFVARIQAANR